MHLKFVTTLVATLLSTTAFADRAQYAGTADLTAARGTLSVRHHHDWSKFPQQLKYSASTPFGVEASVSNLEFSEHGKSVGTIASPPLTYTYVTEDARYVVGLSSIKFGNDVQLVVFDRDAKVLLRRHISADVYRLTASDYSALRAAHAEIFSQLNGLARSTQVGYAWRDKGFVYLDIWTTGGTPEWSSFFDKVQRFRVHSPWSANFGESVSNSVHWYDTKNPGVRIVEKNNQPERIEIRDPKGVAMSMPFNLLPAD
jgi:hypothetical protein